VIEDQLGDDPEIAPMRLAHESAELGARAVGGVDVVVVGDVVAVVAARGRIERQQPHGVDAEILDVLELARETGEIPAAIVVAVEEGADVHLVDHGVLEPQGIAAGGRRRIAAGARPALRARAPGCPSVGSHALQSGVSTSTASGGNRTSRE
jgi:hypothetical protein